MSSKDILIPYNGKLRLKNALRKKFDGKLPFTENIKIRDVTIAFIYSSDVIFKFALAKLINIYKTSELMFKITMSKKKFLKHYPKLGNDIEDDGKDITFYMMFPREEKYRTIFMLEEEPLLCMIEDMPLWFTLSISSQLNECFKLNLIIDSESITDVRAENKLFDPWNLHYKYLFTNNIWNIINNSPYSTIIVKKDERLEDKFPDEYTIINKVYDKSGKLMYFGLLKPYASKFFRQISFMKIESKLDNEFFEHSNVEEGDDVYIIQSSSRIRCYEYSEVLGILPAEYWNVTPESDLIIMKRNLKQMSDMTNYTLYDRLNANKLMTEPCGQSIKRVAFHNSLDWWR